MREESESQAVPCPTLRPEYISAWKEVLADVRATRKENTRQADLLCVKLSAGGIALVVTMLGLGGFGGEVGTDFWITTLTLTSVSAWLLSLTMLLCSGRFASSHQSRAELEIINALDENRPVDATLTETSKVVDHMDVIATVLVPSGAFLLLLALAISSTKESESTMSNQPTSKPTTTGKLVEVDKAQQAIKPPKTAPYGAPVKPPPKAD